jgi:hypothetical protein
MNAQTHSQSVTTQQTALAAAIKSASDKAQEKADNVANIVKANQPHSQELPMLIPRTDLLNQDVIFLAHTLDRTAETIQYYDMKKGSKPSTAGLGYYKSTRPIKDASKVTKMVQDYSKEFGVKEVILRERLVKSNAPEKAEDGSVNKADLEAWKQKLIQALTKTIMEI